MRNILKIGSGFILSICWTACGVKGKPQPPLTAPVLGRGEPSFSKATEKIKVKRKARPSDWDENGEFPEERGQ